MADISGFGLQLNLVALNTFPRGFELSAFADDSDPFDLPEVTIAEVGMGLNGDLISWKNANPIAVNIAVIPNSDDDNNLQLLAEANRAGKGGLFVSDSLLITGVYPDGSRVTATNGVIVSYMPGHSVASAGRLKTMVYKFMFENILKTPV